MSDVFVFGTYLGQNSNYDSSKTSSRFSSKFRSQFPVPQGTQINDPNNNELYLFEGTTVKLCYVSDLDYQLKNTAPIDDDNWIYRANSARAESYYIGFNPQIQFEYAETNLNLDATNPNGDRFITPAPTPKPVILPQYISFAEERLELGYDYGAVGGPSFATEVIEVADDREQRNASKLLPLGRWQLGDRLIADSEINKLEEFSYLKQFHLDRLGCFQGFRFKDWADYQAFDQYIATRDGVQTQFQLRKAYYAGNAVTYRPILKPVPGTVALYVDDVRVPDISEDPDNGWHINNETGVVTGNLATGARLTANFEFDVPVWFESDTIDFRLEYYDPETKDTVYRLGSVFVVEAPLPPSIPFDIEPSQKITEQLDLGIIYETTETYQISNNKLPLKSGYIRKENKRDDSRIFFNLGSRNYNRTELNKLLGYFYNAKGKSKEWPFNNLGKNYLVRFNEDRLNLKFLASQGDNALFDLSGLKIQVKETIILTIPTLPDFLSSIINFEISDFAITEGSQSIEQNSFSSYGGGSGSSGNSGSSASSGGSGGSGGFGGSFGSTSISVNNLTNGFQPIVQSINFIDGLPVLAMYGFKNVGGSSNDRRYPAIAIPSGVDNGLLVFDTTQSITLNNTARAS